MGRPKKNITENKQETKGASASKASTLTRSRRTPKPNPKYKNEEVLSSASSKNSSRSASPTSANEEIESEERQVITTKAKRGRPAKQVNASKSVPAKKPLEKTSLKDTLTMIKAGRKIGIDKPSETLKRKLSFSDDDDDDDADDDADADEDDLITENIEASADKKIKKDPVANATNITDDKKTVQLRRLKQNIETSSPVTRATRSSDQSINTRISTDSGKEITEDRTEIKEEDSIVKTGKSKDETPTFTIVNIKDIINKKEENTQGKNLKQITGDIKNKTPGRMMKRKLEKFADAISDSEDGSDKKGEEQISLRNRRKSTHTTILNDKEIVMKSATPAKPQTGNTLQSSRHNLSNKIGSQSFNNNTTTLTGKNGKYKDEDNKLTPSPRILNTMLAKKSPQFSSQPRYRTISTTKDVSPFGNKTTTSGILAKKTYTKTNATPLAATISLSQSSLSPSPTTTTTTLTKPTDIRFRTYSSGRNNIINLNKDSKLPTKPILRPISKNNLVPRNRNREPEVIILPDGKTRKITCYETWFVIKLPNDELPVTKALYHFSLIKLGNEIKNITLPSSEWSYRITLQRYKNEYEGDLGERYTGEVQDTNINPDEKHHYRPVNIMFRRTCSDKKLMQFDRAVIFKNKTFFINIDGKNVKLLGAPEYLNTIVDVQTLLEIVNDVSLGNPYVELVKYVL